MATQRARQARLALYFAARLKGRTKHQAAEDIGVSLGTMAIYEREWLEVQKTKGQELKSLSPPSVMSKMDLALRLSGAIASDNTPPQYLSALARALADIEGYNAPNRVDVHNSSPAYSIRDILDQWKSERQQTGGAPPRDSKDLSLGASPAATDQEKRSSQPLDSKATSDPDAEKVKKLETAIEKSSVINKLQNQNSDAQDPKRS